MSTTDSHGGSESQDGAPVQRWGIWLERENGWLADATGAVTYSNDDDAGVVASELGTGAIVRPYPEPAPAQRWGVWLTYRGRWHQSLRGGDWITTDKEVAFDEAGDVRRSGLHAVAAPYPDPGHAVSDPAQKPAAPPHAYGSAPMRAPGHVVRETWSPEISEATLGNTELSAEKLFANVNRPGSRPTLAGAQRPSESLQEQIAQSAEDYAYAAGLRTRPAPPGCAHSTGRSLGCIACHDRDVRLLDEQIALNAKQHRELTVLRANECNHRWQMDEAAERLSCSECDAPGIDGRVLRALGFRRFGERPYTTSALADKCQTLADENTKLLAENARLRRGKR